MDIKIPIKFPFKILVFYITDTHFKSIFIESGHIDRQKISPLKVLR
jgi:hypothetical protein